jgi:hypothetical protein
MAPQPLVSGLTLIRRTGDSAVPARQTHVAETTSLGNPPAVPTPRGRLLS